MDVKDQRIAELETLLQAALEETARLSEHIVALEKKLNKNSANSSKPPSSDIVKPPKPRKGQPGQKRKKEFKQLKFRHVDWRALNWVGFTNVVRSTDKTTYFLDGIEITNEAVAS